MHNIVIHYILYKAVFMWHLIYNILALLCIILNSSNYRITRMPTAAPTGPPQNLIGTTPTSTTLSLSWIPPPVEEQNGVIRSYRITVINEETGSSLMYSTIGTSYLLSDLHPYHRYNCSVAAYTVETGPSSSITVRQPEDGKYIVVCVQR